MVSVREFHQRDDREGIGRRVGSDTLHPRVGIAIFHSFNPKRARGGTELILRRAAEGPCGVVRESIVAFWRRLSVRELVRFHDALAVLDGDGEVVCPVEEKNRATEILNVVNGWVLVIDELGAGREGQGGGERRRNSHEMKDKWNDSEEERVGVVVDRIRDGGEGGGKDETRRVERQRWSVV
jgi:hypothetical protein